MLGTLPPARCTNSGSAANISRSNTRGPVRAHGAERCAQGRTLRERRDALHALIDAPRGDAHALAGGPRRNGSALRLGRQALFALGRAQVGDGDGRDAHGSALAHEAVRTGAQQDLREGVAPGSPGPRELAAAERASHFDRRFIDALIEEGAASRSAAHG